MVTKFPESGVFFTSDTHFGHKNILDFCHRPFSCIEEHDEVLIANWNSVVGPDDTVFHLGDFAFGGYPFWEKIVKQLNGHIILIKGNHEWKNWTAGIETLFDYSTQQMRILIGNRTVYLNHFPFLCFAHDNIEIYKENNLTYALSGHTHIRKNDTGTDAIYASLYKPTQYDVGVDLNNYTPISWREVDAKIKFQIKNKCNLTHWLK